MISRLRWWFAMRALRKAAGALHRAEVQQFLNKKGNP